MTFSDLHSLITKLISKNIDISKYRISSSFYKNNSFEFDLGRTIYIIDNCNFDIDFSTIEDRDNIMCFYKNMNRVLKIKNLLK